MFYCSLLTRFRKILLTGDTSLNVPSARIQRLLQSFCADYVYSISNGVHKPAKHILLTSAVKDLTGNVELIKLLNRLGHAISYTQWEELDTAVCLKKKVESIQSSVMLPSSILPCIPTTVVWDNIDRTEKTLSGGGTSHRVNGIIVQPQVPTVAGPPCANVDVKAKKRSIDAETSMIPPYNGGEMVGPQHKMAMDVDTNKEVETARMKNHVWS